MAVTKNLKPQQLTPVTGISVPHAGSVKGSGGGGEPSAPSRCSRAGFAQPGSGERCRLGFLWGWMGLCPAVAMAPSECAQFLIPFILSNLNNCMWLVAAVSTVQCRASSLFAII